MAFPNMAAWAAKKGKKPVDPKAAKVAPKDPAEVDPEDHEVDGDVEEEEAGAKPVKGKVPGGFAAFIKRKRGG